MLRIGLSREVQVDRRQVFLSQTVKRVLNDHRLAYTSLSCEEDGFASREEQFDKIAVLVCHVCLDHNVEEGFFLAKLEFLNFLAPGSEHVPLQVVEVVEHSEGSWVLSRLEAVLHCSIEVVLRPVIKRRS